MPKRPSFAAGVAAVMLIVAYFVFLGLAASALVVASGVDPLALQGALIFVFVVLGELTMLFVLDKPGPFLIIFAVPAIIGYIAIKGAFHSDSVIRLIKQIEETLRTSPFGLRPRFV
jgi:hypothetical protein